MTEKLTINTNQRLTWVDIYKGLAILCIVLGHTASFWTASVYLFHIAAFFFIAGYTSKPTDNFADFLLKKIRALLVPFWVCNLLFVLLRYLIEKYQVNLLFPPVASYDLLSAVNALIFTKSTEDIGGATWFLVALFFSHLAFQGILTLVSQLKYQQLALTVIAFLCLLSGYYLGVNQIRFSFMLDVVPMALAFIIPGYQLRQVNIERIFRKFKLAEYAWLPLSVITWWITTQSWAWVFVDFAGRNYGNPIQVFGYGLIGIALLISLAKWIETNSRYLTSLLQTIGAASLWIMCLHFLSFKLGYLLLYAIGLISVEHLGVLVPMKQFAEFWPFHTGLAVLLAIITRNAYQQFKARQLTPFSLFLVCLIWGMIAHAWVFSENHFYFADDFSHLWVWPQQGIASFFSILPQQMYNDRPVGQLFFKILVDLFGTNYRLQHLIIFLIHILNGYLLIVVASSLRAETQKPVSILAIFPGLLFIAWPQINIPVHWISAAFDLLGATFALLYIAVTFSDFLKSKKIIRSLLLVLLVILMARTKEATLFVPVAVMLLDLVISRIRIGKMSRDICQKLILNHFWQVATACSYLGYLYYLRSISDMGFQTADHPYYSSLNPLILITNAFRYLYLFFDLAATKQVFFQFQTTGIVLTSSFLLCCILPLRNRKSVRSYLGIVCLFLFLLTLTPVLPLVNMQHKLYLYLPSIFLFLGVGFITEQLLVRKIFVVSIVVIGLSALLLFNHYGIKSINEINWYLGIGKENRQVFAALSDAVIPSKIKTLNIYNVSSETNILQFGEGQAVIKLVTGRSDLVVNWTKDTAQKKSFPANAQTWALNYQKLSQGLFQPRSVKQQRLRSANY